MNSLKCLKLTITGQTAAEIINLRALNDREIFKNTGSISHELAKDNSEREFEKYKEKEQIMITEGDFEKAIKKIENKNRNN